MERTQNPRLHKVLHPQRVRRGLEAQGETLLKSLPLPATAPRPRGFCPHPFP